MQKAWLRPAGQALSGAFGVLLSAALWQGLHAKSEARPKEAARVSIQSRPANRPVAPEQALAPGPAPPEVTASIPPEVLPLRNKNVAPKKRPKPSIPVPSPQNAVVVEVQPLGDMATISQPAFAANPTPVLQDLPVIDTSGVPPAPAEPIAFSLAQVIKPYGMALVLGVLLDEKGIGVESRIVVPSAYPLQDITFTFAHIGKQWLDLSPPLQPGEKRWIELRIDYNPGTPTQDLIP